MTVTSHERHVSNYQQLHCLFNSLIRPTVKKTPKLRITALYKGIHRWPNLLPSFRLHVYATCWLKIIGAFRCKYKIARLYLISTWMIKRSNQKQHHITYHQTSNISRTLVGNKLVDNSYVVGASPVGAPTTSSFSTQHLDLMDWAKTTAIEDENHLSFGIWCSLY